MTIDEYRHVSSHLIKAIRQLSMSLCFSQTLRLPHRECCWGYLQLTSAILSYGLAHTMCVAGIKTSVVEWELYRQDCMSCEGDYEVDEKQLCFQHDISLHHFIIQWNQTKVTAKSSRTSRSLRKLSKL